MKYRLVTPGGFVIDMELNFSSVARSDGRKARAKLMQAEAIVTAHYGVGEGAGGLSIFVKTT